MNSLQIESYFPSDDTQIFRIFDPQNFPKPNDPLAEIGAYGIQEIAQLTSKILPGVEPFEVTSHWSEMIKSIVKSDDFCLIQKSNPRNFWSKILSDRSNQYQTGATVDDSSNHLSLLIRRILVISVSTAEVERSFRWVFGLLSTHFGPFRPLLTYLNHF